MYKHIHKTEYYVRFFWLSGLAAGAQSWEPRWLCTLQRWLSSEENSVWEERPSEREVIEMPATWKVSKANVSLLTRETITERRSRGRMPISPSQIRRELPLLYSPSLDELVFKRRKMVWGSLIFHSQPKSGFTGNRGIEELWI